MRSVFLIVLFLVLGGCHEGNVSPYEEVLLRPPYSELTDSIRANPSDPDLYYRRGSLLSRNNNNLPALADFKKAWSIQPKELYAINISNILLQDKPDSAIVFIKEAVKRWPSSLALQISLVEGYADEKKTTEALQLCDGILHQYPDEVSILMMKSDLQDQINDTVGSMRTLEQAYKFAPANENLCYGLAFKYAQNKDARVLELCDSLLEKDTVEHKAEPYYFEGVYYSNINNKSKALDFFNRAIENDFNFLDAYMEKGRLLFEQKKLARATAVFQLALKVSPAYADAYYWLGKCQEQSGDKQAAKLNYKRAFGLDKSLTEAKESADRLN